MSSKKTDAQIQSDVLQALRGDTRVRAADIGVTVQSGVVTLAGRVDSWARRLAAQDAAHRVQGVLDVANDITIEPAGTHARTDADVAKAVRLALVWDIRVPDEQIKSTVTDGLVTLEGTVDYWTQREDAEKAVRYLAGVRAVTNLIGVQAPEVTPSEVRKAIDDALARQARRDSQEITTRMEGGRVTLTGVVPSWAERRAVLDAVGATYGVREVIDRLRIEPWN